MDSPAQPQQPESEPPIETGTSWGYKLVGLFFATPISVVIGSMPWGWILLGSLMNRKAVVEPDISAALICFLSAFNLVMAVIGLLFLLGGLGALLQRVRVDTEGLHVRAVKWRHFPWFRLSHHNFVALKSNSGDYYGYVPHSPDEDPTVPIKDSIVVWRALLSPASFCFSAFPRKARVEMLRRIHAHLPEPISPVLPDALRFRTGEIPLRKRVVVDRSGLSVSSWGRERRYAWDDVKEMVIHCSSPKYLHVERLYIGLYDGKELAFMKVSRFARGEPAPDKEIIAAFFRSHIPKNRVIDLTPGAPESVEALEFQLQSIQQAINSNARIAVWSLVTGVALLGLGILWLFLTAGDVPKETLTRITLWYSLATVFIVGLYGILPYLHGILFRLPDVQKKLDEACTRENVKRGGTLPYNVRQCRSGPDETGRHSQ